MVAAPECDRLKAGDSAAVEFRVDWFVLLCCDLFVPRGFGVGV